MQFSIVLTLNKKQFLKNIIFYILFIHTPQIFLNDFQVNAQESSKLNEIEINSSTKSSSDNDASFPTNPFEIVDMIRRINSMNDATKPSDALDEAIKSFDMINTKESL